MLFFVKNIYKNADKNGQMDMQEDVNGTIMELQFVLGDQGYDLIYFSEFGFKLHFFSRYLMKSSESGLMR